MVDGRAILKLKSADVVPPEEDRRVELATYDVLLPCRRYEVGYKVAVLGQVSPTLEFLLRLLKALDGMREEEIRTFFGYTMTEMEYVVAEATTPGYVDRRDSRLWLKSAGEALFAEGEGEPAIFTVENRKSTFGFDQLSIAPQPHTGLDRMEMGLPDLSLESAAGVGSASKTVEARFHHFFRELGDREDRERVQRKDLYSIDSVVPGDRYQVPVRIKVFSRASSPSVGELDLTAWRPDQEMSDRPQIEQAAGRFVGELKVLKNPERDTAAYRTMIELAPDFFKEFAVASGLSVERYWREAVSRAGEPRTDRRTVALAGSLFTQGNIERFLRVVDYGLRQAGPPEMIFAIPAQLRNWGATSLLRDLNALLRRKLRTEGPDGPSEPETCCVFPGKAPKYLAQCFDAVEAIDGTELSPGLEIHFIPGVAAVVLVHAPIGPLQNGIPAPLGIATFDPAVLERIEATLLAKVTRYIPDLGRRGKLEQDIARSSRPVDATGPGGNDDPAVD